MIGPTLGEAQIWHEARDRLVRSSLLGQGEHTLSVRIPGRTAFCLGGRSDAAPVPIDWSRDIRSESAEIHAAIYRARSDVGAIARIGAGFSDLLADFGGTLPQVFDEQARHIGPMPPRACDRTEEIASVIARTGNALLFGGHVFCFGITPNRMTLNAELTEKCAKAFVLAAATGARVRKLPMLVRYIANGRLDKDKRRAVEAFAGGRWPAEIKGY